MLKKLAISKRVALGIFIPLLGLLIVGSMATWNAYRNYNASVLLGYATEAVNELAVLTETLQVERGQSAIMIGAGLKKAQIELITARKTTNAEVKLIHTVNEHVHHSGDVQLIAGLDSLEEELKTLAEIRAEIDAGSVELADAMKYYSTTISHILDLGYVAAKKANNAELALESIAMLELAEAKEYAGQERGFLAGLISAKAVTSDQLSKLEHFKGKQDILIANFVRSQPQVTYERFKAMINGIDESDVNLARQQIRQAAYSNTEVTINTTTWFATATKRIAALRAIEIEAIKIIAESGAHVKDNFRNQTLLMGLVSLFSLVGAIVAGVFIALSIRKDIFRTSDEMKALAEGDTSFEISGIGDRTEIGKMAEAIQVFKENTIARVEMEGEAEEERERVEDSRAKAEQFRAEKQHEVETVVNSLGEALQRLASGDLTNGISTEYADEFAQLKNDFGDSISRLSNVMNEINQVTVDISDNSNELRIASDELAKRTEQQAAALEETSAALEEITGNVKESADRANEAREKAGIAKESTNKSSVVVKDAVNAMERIEAASGEIENIISVIDEIAFQTNLLALNAGVEAARAGDAGKGFAVVAQEVRELAQRSAAAAKQIKELIINSGKEVSSGVSLVKATGEALTEISEQVIEIDTHIQSIARASAEQSEGLTEVNKAVNEMDQVTQRNAAMVEETTAVTHRLSEDAETLAGLVGQFQTDKTAEQADTTSSARQAA
jgi:methyl-accepting chemotaxis protein